MLLRRRDFALFWILTNNRKVFRRSGTAGFQTGEAVGCFGEYPPDRRGPEIENDFERESDASTQPAEGCAPRDDGRLELQFSRRVAKE